MALNRYGIYPAIFSGGSTLNLPQLGMAQADPGSTIERVIPSGAVDPAANIVSSGRPTAAIRTLDLKTFFTTVSPSTGFSCTGGALFHYQQRASGGVFSGGSTNIILTSTKGFLLPQRLSANENGPADLTAQYLCLYDGTNIPFTIAASQSLSDAPSPAFASMYFLGPLYVNAAQVEGIIGVNIDFGITASPRTPDGLVWPTHCPIVRRQPVIGVTFLKAEVLPSTLVSFIHAATAGIIACYFKRGLPGAVRVADASITDSHLKITAASGTYQPAGIEVSGEDDTTVTINILPTAALGVGLAVAIGS